MKARAISPLQFVAACALWMATVGNWPLWRKLAMLGLLGTPRGIALAIGMGMIVFGALVVLLGCFAWRGTLKIVAAALLFIAALSAHFMLAYGVIIDPGIVLSALQTDVRESMALVSWRLVAMTVVLAVLPGWLLWRRPVDYGSLQRQLGRNLLMIVLGVCCSGVAAIATFQSLSSVLRNDKEVRYLVNPLAALYSAGRVAFRSAARYDTTVVPLGEDATLARGGGEHHRPAILLLVLGETARSGNFAINGYSRPTTPELQREGAVSFTNAWACGTSTAESLPCMFSNLGRKQFASSKVRHEGLLDVMQRAGMAVLWIDNQTGCKGVCDRIPSVSTTGSSTSPLCSTGQCLDAVMLDGLDRRIADLDPARVGRGLVIVMHQMGSHGPAYYLRSPEGSKPFQPECTSTSLQECSREAVVNAYDNSILYTDHFLGQAISWLKARSDRADTALIYVADHGESLGENNLYLHGMPYFLAPDLQKHVPWISWLSDDFRQSTGLSLGCLKAAQDQPISHDNYFHSVLGIVGVSTQAYRPSLDVYANCRGDLVAQASGGRLH